MHIVIIGNGVSGITAARYLRKHSDHEITVISSESDHFFSRTALMYVYMGHMRFEDIKPYEDWFWEKNRIRLQRGMVKHIDFATKKLSVGDGDTISYDKLVIGVGSASNKFGWPGQDLNRVQGLYHLQDLEKMLKCTPLINRAVIVGGGLIGIEMAEMFHSRHIPVTFLVREKSFWDIVLPPEESDMINRHIVEHGIDLRLETELKEILDDGKGNATAVITNQGEHIDCEFVGLTAGVHPNIGFLKNTELETNRGILVNDYLETNIKDVYAIGDCAEMRTPKPGRRPIEAVWYTGRMMGEVVAHTICNQKTPYDPGIWFNSAKFFDIEYQVYGKIKTQPEPHEVSLFWMEKAGKRSVRIVYHHHSKEVIGFNLMGIRFRHEVCEKWLQEKASIEQVLEQLELANFDPEFYPSFESHLRSEYHLQTRIEIEPNHSRAWNEVLTFLKSN